MFHGLHQQRALLAGERVAALRAGQLGDRADVPGRAGRHRALLLAQGRGQRADALVGVMVGVTAFGHPVPGYVHDGVARPQRAGEHPGPG